MRLLKLEIEPSGITGWGFKSHKFGNDITQIYGSNGCGKTVIIQSIVYAMGYSIPYGNEILDNCKAVILQCAHGEINIQLKRQIQNEFHVECIRSDVVEKKIFHSDKDLFSYLSNLYGLKTSTLISTQGKQTPVYTSTFLPLFYIDQDSGYKQVYASPSNFIKDQYAEMIRLSLGMPAKHSFEEKQLVLKRTRDLKLTNTEIVTQKQFLDTLYEQRTGSTRSSDQLKRELNDLQNDLDELNHTQDATYSADSITRSLMQTKSFEKKTLDQNIKELEDRISGFKIIQEEIKSEIETLSRNEEARRIFTSFSDICANPQCQLFLNSSESYGKNLLYLKDQMKDLDKNTNYHEKHIIELKNKSRQISDEVEEIKNSLSSKKPKGLGEAISRLAKSILEMQSEKEVIDRIEIEESKYNELLNHRKTIQNDIATMHPGKTSTDLRLLEFISDLKNCLQEWLNVLSTKNVSRDISIDSDFNISFGNNKIRQITGSTLLRVILAIKAAFFDVYISRCAPHIEFIIFDTPRQHDIEEKHFKSFIERLKNMVKHNSCQVIFSTTEYHYVPQEQDAEWIPEFSGEEQNMFLGILDRNN